MRNAALVISVLLVACGNGERPGPTTGNTASAKRTLRLAIVTDLQGQLEPCGCQSRPLGGIDRLATAVERLRADGTPTLLLLAGDIIFGPDNGHGHTSEPDAAQQDAWRAETVVEILNRLGAAAVMPGEADGRHGATRSDGLITRLSARSLLAGPGDAPRIPSLLQEVGGTKVAVVGVGGEPSEDLGALTVELKRLRANGASIVVALVAGDRRAANHVARIDGVDFVVSGGIDNKQPTPPARVAHGHVFTAGRQGEGLLNVEISRVGDGPFADRSPWSRERDTQALDRSIEELESKIAAWDQQPSVDRGALNEQKARLATLTQQRRAAVAPTTNGNHFVANWVEIGVEVPREPNIEGVIGAYNRRVNDHNRVALAGVRAPEPESGQPRYVGAAQCQSCHQAAFTWWNRHAHGRAYATLQEGHKEFNLSCVGCHVTGYNRPGGSAVVQNAGLTNVGCESCHGPGSQHVEDPDAEPYSVERVVPEPVCVGCHNAEHSDQFDYAKYREKLLVPGHGRPVVAPPPTPTTPP